MVLAFQALHPYSSEALNILNSSASHGPDVQFQDSPASLLVSFVLVPTLNVCFFFFLGNDHTDPLHLESSILQETLEEQMVITTAAASFYSHTQIYTDDPYFHHMHIPLEHTVCLFSPA